MSIPGKIKKYSYYDGQMLDITAPKLVQVQVSNNGRLWVNVDGVCRLRVCKAGDIEVADNYKKKGKSNGKFK